MAYRPVSVVCVNTQQRYCAFARFPARMLINSVKTQHGADGFNLVAFEKQNVLETSVLCIQVAVNLYTQTFVKINFLCVTKDVLTRAHTWVTPFHVNTTFQVLFVAVSSLRDLCPGVGVVCHRVFPCTAILCVRWAQSTIPWLATTNGPRRQRRRRRIRLTRTSG